MNNLNQESQENNIYIETETDASDFFQTETNNPGIDEIEETGTFSREEQLNIAGVEETETLELDEQFQIREDRGRAQTTEDNPVVRTGFTAGILGLFILVIALVWQGMKPKDPELKLVNTNEETTIITDSKPEVDYRGKLSLRDQKHQLEKTPELNQEKVEPPKEKSPEIKEETKPEPIVQPAPPQNRPVAVTRPRVNVPRPEPKEERKQDPTKLWKDLANFGIGENITASEINTTPITNNLKAVSTNNPQRNETQTLVTQVNYNQAENAIINRQKVEPKKINIINYGTTAKGKISTPLIWDDSTNRENQVSNIFSITLDEDIKNSNNETILEKGITLLVKADNVNGANRFVNAYVTNIHPKDGNLTIPEGKLIILNKKQEPLIAKAYIDNTQDTIKTDLTILALDSLGAVGEIATEPNSTSSIVTNGSFSSSSTTVDNGDKELWGAALQGFDGLSERINRRATEAESQRREKPNISFLPVGTEISIIAVDNIQIDINHR